MSIRFLILYLCVLKINGVMQYLYLSLAIIFEVLGSSFIKASDGFTKLIPTLVVGVTYIICFYFLSLCLKTMPLGAAYAIWGGVGITLTAFVSVFILKQPIDLPAIVGIALIVGGVVVINFFSNTLSY